MFSSAHATPQSPEAMLLDGYSAEVTSPDRKSLDAAADLMPKGSRVYIASLPNDDPQKVVEAAVHLMKADLVPVPHVVARNLKSEDHFDSLLARLAGEAGVDRALILGGDRDDSAGPYTCALELIESGILNRHGIDKIGLGIYPEGHPRIATDVLDKALDEKLAAAKAHDLETVLISQLCFDADAILKFIRTLRARGITNRIRVGLSGPAKRTTLIKYAMICGVGPSLRALKERQEMTKNLLSGERPDALVKALAEANLSDPALNIWGVHFFTFAAFKNTIDFVNEYL
ncbi:methylenetetrahydrofolate reductase [Kordiimonas marina]|uniref:methylenetetrahydrofolate reductase n=1 Tax=Kordiimonas marina TaxID=2872312 RepID=UPI001FF445E6|nr:methylenetetrahydrofolate reductase [Kordiimonas marina]MCJ9427771.1 methylenetetrahydrofolate reductase [Kordiimonas marina]